MATTTLSNEEILEAIGNKTVVELADLIDAFKTKFNVTVAAAPAGGAGGAAGAPAGGAAPAFPVLGTAGGTFYVGERELTIENAKEVGEVCDAAEPSD